MEQCVVSCESWQRGSIFANAFFWNYNDGAEIVIIAQPPTPHSSFTSLKYIQILIKDYSEY